MARNKKYNGTPVVPQPAEGQKFLAVYGTLRKGQGNWSALLKDKTDREWRGRVYGATMYVAGCPYVVLDPDKKNSVVVDVFEIDPAIYNAVMNRVDQLEGYHGPEASNHYDRIVVPVEITVHDKPVMVDCHMYVAHNKEISKTARRCYSGDYLTYRNTYGNKRYQGGWDDGYEDDDDLAWYGQNYGKSGTQKYGPVAAERTLDGATYYLYFAYGSNLSTRRMTQRGVSWITRELAVLPGWRLEFNKEGSGLTSGFANVVKDKKSSVEGALYLIENKGISKLDGAEGEGWAYLRTTIGVTRAADGKKVQAVIYLAHPARVEEGLKPTKFYLDYLLEGADILTPDYVAALKAVPTTAESYGSSGYYGADGQWKSWNDWGKNSRNVRSVTSYTKGGITKTVETYDDGTSSETTNDKALVVYGGHFQKSQYGNYQVWVPDAKNGESGDDDETTSVSVAAPNASVARSGEVVTGAVKAALAVMETKDSGVAAEDEPRNWWEDDDAWQAYLDYCNESARARKDEDRATVVEEATRTWAQAMKDAEADGVEVDELERYEQYWQDLQELSEVGGDERELVGVGSIHRIPIDQPLNADGEPYYE